MSTEIRFESDPTGTPTVNEYPIGDQVAVSSTATQVAPNRAGRNSVTLKNQDGTNSVFIGNSGVTDTTGLELAAGEGVTIETERAVYAICSSGQEVTVGVLEDGPNK